MKEFLLALFFGLLLLTVLPQSSLAYEQRVQGNGSFSDTTFVIRTTDANNPSNEQPDVESELAIDITTLDKDGNPVDRLIGASYSISLWAPNQAESMCHTKNGLGISLPYTLTSSSGDARGKITIVSPNQLKINYDLSLGGCLIKPGSLNLTLWAGSSARDNSNTIVNPTNIYIDQVGGGIADIQPYSSDPNKNLICPGRPVVVNLLGSKKNSTYSFWWDGDWVKDLKIKGTDLPSSTVEIDASTRTDPNQYKLCMQLDKNSEIPYFRTCEKYVTFTKPSDPVKQCSNLSPTCPLNLAVDAANSNAFNASIVGENYAPGQNYRIDILDKQTGQNVRESFPATSGSDGRINETVGVLPAGKYGVYVYNAGDATRVCTNDNADVTSQAGETKPPVKACSEDPESPNYCAYGAGAGCNPKDGTIDTTPTAQGVMTAIGCVPTSPQRLISGLMKYVLGFGGGVALLLMIFGSFGMITSSGNPDAIKKGREQFVNAIIGLLFIIFSTLFMEILGVDILGLPGFS